MENYIECESHVNNIAVRVTDWVGIWIRLPVSDHWPLWWRKEDNVNEQVLEGQLGSGLLRPFRMAWRPSLRIIPMSEYIAPNTSWLPICRSNKLIQPEKIQTGRDRGRDKQKAGRWSRRTAEHTGTMDPTGEAWMTKWAWQGRGSTYS